MTTPEAQTAILADLISAGTTLSGKLAASVARLGPHLPVDASFVARQDEDSAVQTDALLLRFANLTMLVQDQLLRALLLAEQEPLDGKSRRDALLLAEKLGALDPGLDYGTVTTARNRVAHAYPNDPARQASMINDVARAAPVLIAIFDGYVRHVKGRGLA